MRNELVPLLPSNQAIQVVQEVESLLIRNTGERIIRVLVLQVDDELGELVIGTEQLYTLSESFPANDRRKVKVLRTVEGSLYPSLWSSETLAPTRKRNRQLRSLTYVDGPTLRMSALYQEIHSQKVRLTSLSLTHGNVSMQPVDLVVGILPEMLPGSVRHQIPTPAVRQFVGNDIDI